MEPSRRVQCVPVQEVRSQILRRDHPVLDHPGLPGDQRVEEHLGAELGLDIGDGVRAQMSDQL